MQTAWGGAWKPCPMTLWQPCSNIKKSGCHRHHKRCELLYLMQPFKCNHNLREWHEGHESMSECLRIQVLFLCTVTRCLTQVIRGIVCTHANCNDLYKHLYMAVQPVSPQHASCMAFNSLFTLSGFLTMTAYYHPQPAHLLNSKEAFWYRLNSVTQYAARGCVACRCSFQGTLGK